MSPPPGSEANMADLAPRARRWGLIAALVVAIPVVLIGAAAAVIYGGVYDIGADEPHSQPVFWLMQMARYRSVAAHATDTIPGDLSDPKRITSGAGQYDEMCSGCHLAPGMQRTEISRGLYPRAPELRRRTQLTPAEQFWVIKHGIKMTGMPAWGVTHDDDVLWDVVAFLRKLPQLTADQYQALVKSAPKTHSEMMRGMQTHSGHDHDGKPDQ